VSALHAHLVFVMKYRGPVFTDAMLTFCEHTMRAVCADLDTKSSFADFQSATPQHHCSHAAGSFEYLE
jgi:hypothetical protein